jgi:hypothetical protein
VPQHVVPLVARLVVDYFTYVARPCASAYSAARHAAHRAARRRLLRLHHASQVPRHVARLVTRLVVDYSACAARQVPWHVARLVAPFIVDYA